MPIGFQPSEGPPRVTRKGGGRQGGTTQFQALIDACHADPGEWFEIDCDGNKHKAYARSQALRKNYGLDAKARGATVFVRLAPEGEAVEEDANEDVAAAV